ncbi:MAG TPA: M50 family metallopeptidase [Chloroflexota bacterium]
MTLGLGILTFVVVLAVLILVHELGHFTFAKIMGVRVEEFGLGFPPRMKWWRRNGTVYSINAIPIGGFVKMLGENGDQQSADSFGSKAPWQRLMILLAGPGMNLMLALTIFFFVFLAGAPRGLTVVTAVNRGSPAALAGLRIGDRIVQANGQPVTYLDQLQTVTSGNLGQRIPLRVLRGRHIVDTTLVPRVNPPKNQGPMGVVLGDTVNYSYGPGHSLQLAVRQVGIMVASIPLLIQSVQQHGGNGVSGPIGIAHITTQVVHDEPQQGFGSILEFVALLSANLGVLNLLPIPALDGGRIVFVLISWIRRRNLDPEVEGLIHLVGMAVLLLLITLVSYHDLLQWIGGGSF